MPIYEYQCEGCGEVFEVNQKMSDPPLKKHAECGSKKVKKLISNTSFQLKGSGWYVTDYKKSSPQKDETKTEAKAAETKETPAPAAKEESKKPDPPKKKKGKAA